MIGFLLKKAFWDTWDNMGRILLVNLGLILLLVFPVFIPQWLAGTPVLSLTVLIAGILAVFVYTGGVSRYIKDVVYYKSPEVRDILLYIKESWKQSLFFGIAASVFYMVFFIGFRFYSQLGNTVGLIGIAFLFWIFVLVSIGSVFYFPVLNSLDRDIRKILKKCFILLFDNIGAALVLFIGLLFNTALSIVLAFILPGIGGVFVLLESGMKLLMMKYDYLEENPDADRKKIPWNALLRDEREKIGKRTLKGTIFPWKD